MNLLGIHVILALVDRIVNVGRLTVKQFVLACRIISVVPLDVDLSVLLVQSVLKIKPVLIRNVQTPVRAHAV